MRDFGTVHTRYWDWAQKQDLKEGVKLLGVYLLTSPHSNSLGFFRLPTTYVAEDLGYSIDRVSKGYDILYRKGFLEYCDASKYIILRKYLKWNPPQNPKHAKSIIKQIHQTPSDCQVIETLMESIIKYGGKYIPYTVCDTLYNTVSKDYRYKEQEQEQEQEREQEPEKKKKFTPPNLKTVEGYFKENGYPPSLAKKFFQYYDAGGWRDQRGNPVKGWKQKAIAVWFKPENKQNNEPSKLPEVTDDIYGK